MSKEALTQPEQEPVAYMVKAHGMLQRLSRRADVADELACQYREDDPNAEVLPLYTSQPAQREPEYWLWACGQHIQVSLKKPEFPDAIPLYTSPPAQRKPLTDEEIWDEVKAADLDWQTGWSWDEDASNRYITLARAIEAAHGIKENT